MSAAILDDEIVEIEEASADEPPERLATVHTIDDPVKDWLKEIAKRKLLSAEEEVDLAKRIEAGLYARKILAGDEIPGPKVREALDAAGTKSVRQLRAVIEDGRRAMTQMVEANLRYPVKLARRFSGRGVLFMDLLQEGNLGVIRAVEKFDYTLGFKFSTYADMWVKQTINRVIHRQARTVIIPERTVELFYKIAATRRRLFAESGRIPTTEDIATELDVTPDRVEEVEHACRDAVSLHATIGDDGHVLADFIQSVDAVSPFEEVDFHLRRKFVHSLVDDLPEDEAEVIKLRFGLTGKVAMTQAQVGAVIRASASTVGKIERRAKANLKARFRTK